jgi:hypothetical protein
MVVKGSDAGLKAKMDMHTQKLIGMEDKIEQIWKATG